MVKVEKTECDECGCIEDNIKNFGIQNDLCGDCLEANAIYQFAIKKEREGTQEAIGSVLLEMKTIEEVIEYAKRLVDNEV